MQSSLQPGMTLCGKYKILQKIGKGGMAFVFKAYSIEYDKECALKEMQDQYLDPESKDKITAQFMNEATTLKKLDHPGVPYVLETFESEGKHYLAMEYVSGDTLEDFVVNSPALLTLDQVLGIVWQITDILKYLHNLPEPVILRDLKPSNLMLNKDGKIKIIDFGIAKVFEQGNASRTMAKIKGSGSSGFAPPEQYGAGGTDKRSDIYAFGVTIYYLLTGQILPDSVDRILSGGKLDPVKDVNPTAGNEIQAMIEKMVQLKPADRFQNIEEVIEYLNNHGMSGDFPLLKPYSESHSAVDSENDDDDDSEYTNFGRRQDDDEEEEDTRIFLPRQIYTKRPQQITQNEEEVKEEEQKEESFRKSDIKSRFDASNMPLQTEKLLGSAGIADGIKSDGSLSRKIEEIGKEPTRKLDKSDLEKYLKPKNTDITSSKKEEKQPKEVKEKKPVNWGCVVLLSLFMILLIAIIYAFIALKDINPFIPTKEKIKKQKEEAVVVKVETPKPVETKPVITYVEESLKGKISAVEKVGNSKHLILKSYLDSKYVKLKPGKTPLPEGLKVGSEISVIYKIPKTNPKQPFEIIEIKLTNPPAKKPSSTNSSGSSSYTPPSSSSGYSSGSSSYRSSGSSSGYSSGSSSYSRSSGSSSGYSSGSSSYSRSSGSSSSYTPPSRSSGTSSSYSSGSSSSSSSKSESGGFTQQRATDY